MQGLGPAINDYIAAIFTASQPSSTPAERAASLAVLNQLKATDSSHLILVAPQLLDRSRPVEVQHYGYQLLQQLVTTRWRRLQPFQQKQLTDLSYQLVEQGCSVDHAWPIRSKAAMLLALVAKRSNPSFWEQLLPELLTLGSHGPVHARMACLVLRGVAEEVTQYGDDLSADAKRGLLAALLQSLDQTLAFLQHVLASQYSAGSQAAAAGRTHDAQSHAMAVTAAMDALREHTEWPPVGKLVASGLLQALGFLTSTHDFRVSACLCLRFLSARKQAQEEPQSFKSAVAEIGAVLISAASAVLNPAAVSACSAYGPMEEYAMSLSEAMTVYGSLHLDCLTGENYAIFLQQMLALVQHQNLHIAAHALPFWTSLLHAAGSPKAGSPSPFSALPAEVPATLSGLAGEWLRKGSVTGKEVPDGFDDMADWQTFVQDFRAHLSNIMKSISKLMPDAAITAAGQKLQAAVDVIPAGQDHVAHFESAIAFLESVVPPIANAQQKLTPPERSQSVLAALQQLLQQLMAMKVDDAGRCLAQARAIELFAPLTAISPELAAAVIDKVFVMLAELPLESGALGAAPPARLPAGWKDRFTARQRVVNIVVVHAKIAPRAILPHMQSLAQRLQVLTQQGAIWASDSNVVCDGLLAAAACDSAVQGQVTEWVLNPVRMLWSSPQWQQRLTSLDAFLACFSPVQQAPDGSVQVGGGQPRWELYHHLHLLERAVKRLPASTTLGIMATAHPQEPGWHAVNGHLCWSLPILLQLVQCLHTLWTPQGQGMVHLAGAALHMGPKERALHLRLPLSEIPEEEETTLGGSLVSSLRSFFRQVRELVYQALGLMASQVGGCLACTQHCQQWVQALTSHLDHLNMQHMRLLIRHILLPLVRTCPMEHRGTWLLPLLSTVLPLNLQRLHGAWSTLNSVDSMQRESAAAANDEVVQEHLLRELTSEHLLLLCTLNDALAAGRAEATVLAWLLQTGAQEVAFHAIWAATAAMWWPHSDAVSKAATFCKAMVPLVHRGGAQVQEFVACQMLQGCIAALASSSSAAQAELLGLARDILSLRLPQSRQVLQSLPRSSNDLLMEFEQKFEAAATDKDSRHAVKCLLRDAGAEEHASLLSDWKPMVPVTNLSSRKLQGRMKGCADHGTDGHGSIGIAAVNTLL